jgi:hypothetical protein
VPAGTGAVSRRAAGMSGDVAVSVVIIFWNAERFLGEAIAGVLAQSYQGW